MDKTVADRIATALKLSPADRERMAGALRAAAAQLPAGPAKVSLNVNLIASSNLRGAAAVAKGTAPGFDDDLKQLPLAIRQKLATVEPKVLAWVAASQANASQFLMNPLTALRQAAPELDNETHAALAALRSKGSGTPDTPNFELTSLKLGANLSGR
jgi:hypothetical protein